MSSELDADGGPFSVRRGVLGLAGVFKGWMLPRLTVRHNYQVQGASALRGRGTRKLTTEGPDFVAEQLADRDRRELDRLEPRLAVDCGH